jgi:hypothetical protein
MGIETSHADFIDFVNQSPAHLNALHAALGAEDKDVNALLRGLHSIQDEKALNSLARFLASHTSLPATCTADASNFLSSKEFSFIDKAYKDARSPEAHASMKTGQEKRSALHDAGTLSTEQLLTTQDCLYSGIEWLRQVVGVKRVYARCGTLLGAVCWSAMAPWDNDMDVLLGPSDCKLLHAAWEGGERYDAFIGGMYTPEGGWDCRRTALGPELLDGRPNVELCIRSTSWYRAQHDNPWTLKLVPTAEARVEGIGGSRRFNGLDIECTVPREHLLKIHGVVDFNGPGFDAYKMSVGDTGIERYVNAIDAGEEPPDGLPQPRTVKFGPSRIEVVPRKLVEKHFLFRYGEGWKCYPPGAPWLETIALERTVAARDKSHSKMSKRNT